jgi:hypothetical protein
MSYIVIYQAVIFNNVNKIILSLLSIICKVNMALLILKGFKKKSKKVFRNIPKFLSCRQICKIK